MSNQVIRIASKIFARKNNVINLSVWVVAGAPAVDRLGQPTGKTWAQEYAERPEAFVVSQHPDDAAKMWIEG